MTNNQLAPQSRQSTNLKSLINSESMVQQFSKALPKHLSVERFCRIATTALTRTPKLLECTQESFMRCLLDLSAWGLEPDGRRAHLIPYGRECTLVLDYKGITELVMRSGLVSVIHADKVCQNDLFVVDKGDIQTHRIDFKNPRGDAYAYYVLIRFKDGSEKSEVMTKDDVIAIRNRSQGYKAAIQYNKTHPWITDFDEMAKKTVFRRASKWLSVSPEIREAIERDDSEFDTSIRDVTPKHRALSSENPYRDSTAPEAAAIPEAEQSTDKEEDFIPLD